MKNLLSLRQEELNKNSIKSSETFIATIPRSCGKNDEDGSGREPSRTETPIQLTDHHNISRGPTLASDD